jgi:hypothetical protein
MPPLPLLADTVAKVLQATKRATSIRRQCSRGKEDSKRCALQNEHCAANPSSWFLQHYRHKPDLPECPLFGRYQG